MKALITGHKGFIGSFLYDHLRYQFGDTVDGIDFPDDIANFKTDKVYDVVIHLAAFAAIRDSIDNPDKFWDNNVEKSVPIFDYCRNNNVRLLYASTSQVEEWWQNPYGITKKVNEFMARDIPNSVGMRFQTVYGDKSRPDMLYRMLEDKTAKYITNHARDWIHVKDVVRAICYLIPSTYTGIIDVGTGETTEVRKLAQSFGQGDLPIKTDTPGERNITCADTTKLRELGWFPTIKIL